MNEEEVRARLERLAALGARSAELAHELRNALAVLETSLHIVRRALRSSDDLAKVDPQLGRMAEQIHAGQALVRQALEDVRAASPERTPTDVRGLVLEVVGGIERPELVGVDVKVEGGRVPLDPGLIRQLLLNLVRNAVEAIGDGKGTVRILGKIANGELTVRIEDDGPGIDEAIAPRLFQAFATGKRGGTGLGLAVCKRIAEAHGGHIRAARIEPHGTAMEVVIPV
ncbi:MAG: sensor histidine kinase [Polyangiales bacterium]